MKKNRIKAYWLLLLALLYTAAAVLSVGEAQARYVTTATWNTVVQQEANGVTSDCLEAVSEADDFIVLLDTMPQEGSVIPFTLTAREETSGKLTWTVKQPEYISVEMRIDDTPITPETTIDMAAGDTVTVVMTLIPSETAFTEPRDAVNASVEVIWADTLKGTFLTQLPAVEEEEEPTEESEPPTEETEPDPTDPTEPDPTDPTQPQPTDPTEPDPTDPTQPQPTDPTEPQPTDPTQPQPTDPTEPQPTDPTESGAEVTGLRIQKFFQKLFEKSEIPMIPNAETSEDETIPEEEATQPVTETEPVIPDEPDGQSEDTTDPSEPDTPGDGTEDTTEEPSEPAEPTEPSEPTEPTEPIQEETPATDVLLEAVSSVNSADALPIQITAPANIAQVRLGIAAVVQPADPEGESQTVLENFPRYTRFSLTDGASYYMLYHADTIDLNLEDGETISLLLDLSHVELEQPQLVLGATHQGEEAGISTCTTTVIPESAKYITLSSRVLSVGAPLEIVFSDYWKDYNLEYTVEMLTTIDTEGAESFGYVPADLPEGCLLSERVSDETGTKLIFTLGETLPPAGTYRVSLNWTFEDTCYAEMQEIFFINYLAYTESEETGGAEQ